MKLTDRILVGLLSNQGASIIPGNDQVKIKNWDTEVVFKCSQGEITEEKVVKGLSIKSEAVTSGFHKDLIIASVDAWLAAKKMGKARLNDEFVPMISAAVKLGHEGAIEYATEIKNIASRK